MRVLQQYRAGGSSKERRGRNPVAQRPARIEWVGFRGIRFCWFRSYSYHPR
jgi:hypothetical protein